MPKFVHYWTMLRFMANQTCQNWYYVSGRPTYLGLHSQHRPVSADFLDHQFRNRQWQNHWIISGHISFIYISIYAQGDIFSVNFCKYYHAHKHCTKLPECSIEYVWKFIWLIIYQVLTWTLDSHALSWALCVCQCSFGGFGRTLNW